MKLGDAATVLPIVLRTKNYNHGILECKSDTGENMTVPILCVGSTGSGKTYSLRNLPPERTVILNVEKKPLPFRKAGKFKNVDIKKYGDFKKYLKKALESDDYDYVVIDSMTFLADMIEQEGKKIYGKSYDMWTFYADEIKDTLRMMNESSKNCIVMAHPDYITDDELIVGIYAKLKGQLKNGGLESHFSVVLHTHVEEDDDGLSVFKFDTAANSRNSAKSPPEMFESRYVDNELLGVFKAVDAYYADE